MQIVEVSAFGVRSARIELASADSNVTITLFPMIHVGDAFFYEAVYADAFVHDVVLVEGVRSPIARRVTRVYRWLRNSQRIGLAIQPPYPRQADSRARIVLADQTHEEFRAEWRRVPRWLRLSIHFLAPYVALRLRWFGSRLDLAQNLAFDDLTSRDEHLGWDPTLEIFFQAVQHARDKLLLRFLDDELAKAPQGKSRLAIVYGARHMRAVLVALSKRGFHARRTAWLKVFDPL